MNNTAKLAILVGILLLLVLIFAPIALGLALLANQSGKSDQCATNGASVSVSGGGSGQDKQGKVETDPNAPSAKKGFDVGKPNAQGVPENLIPIYQQAAETMKISTGGGYTGATVLAGVNSQETSFGSNLNVSSAGANGWMQFMPKTWEGIRRDGDGDGIANPYNPYDAIYSAARYLKTEGAPGNWRKALFGYNHADWYVNAVLEKARKYNVPAGSGGGGSIGGSTSGGSTSSSADCPPDSAGTVDGNTQQLAQQILDNKNISFPLDGNSPNGSTRKVLQDVAAGGRFYATCPGGVKGKETDVNPGILKFLLEYAQTNKVGVNAITDKCHQSDLHPTGRAIDFECNAVPFDTALADKIAKKYGGQRNFETCAGHRHWHYQWGSNK